MRKWMFSVMLFTIFYLGCTDDTPDCPDLDNIPAVDNLRPSRISNLSASSTTDSTVILAWTAPGDDGVEGRASFYDIRYCVSLVALQEWSTLCLRGPEITPAMSGGNETVTITNLTPDTVYYFALRTADEDSNWSLTSNYLTAETGCSVSFESPSIGSYYCEGDTMDIVWSVSECQSELVDLVLLANGEVRYTIVNDVENTGVFRWQVDANGSLNANFAVGIRQADESAIQESEGSFSITAGCHLGVESPNGGEEFCRGELVRLFWNQSSCCPSGVLVELMLNFSPIDTLETIHYTGDYWAVESPDSAENGYRLRVTNLDTGISDVSDYTFHIAGPQPPSVSYPTGSAILHEGEDVEISWIPGRCLSGSVRIDLEYDGETILAISEMTSDDGEFLWPALSEGDSEDGYRIVVTNLDSGFVGKSPDPFTIERTCHFTYLTPLEGASYCMHDPLEITWDNGRWCSETVSLVILQGGRSIHIAGQVPNTGTWLGTAPQLYYPGGNRVKIIDDDNGDYVVGPGIDLFAPCALNLYYPDGGQNFIVGEPTYIYWDTGVCCGPELRIELLRDGVVCRVIAEATDTSTGLFIWNVEGCDEEDGGYQIRIVESFHDYSAISDNSFTIEHTCGIWISEPMDGQIYYEGDTVSVVWETAPYCGEEMVLKLVDESDTVLYGPVTVNNNGAWQFIPDNMPVGIYYGRVRITDTETGVSAGSWAAEFRIYP